MYGYYYCTIPRYIQSTDIILTATFIVHLHLRFSRSLKIIRWKASSMLNAMIDWAICTDASAAKGCILPFGSHRMRSRNKGHTIFVSALTRATERWPLRLLPLTAPNRNRIPNVFLTFRWVVCCNWSEQLEWRNLSVQKTSRLLRDGMWCDDMLQDFGLIKKRNHQKINRFESMTLCFPYLVSTACSFKYHNYTKRNKRKWRNLRQNSTNIAIVVDLSFQLYLSARTVSRSGHLSMNDDWPVWIFLLNLYNLRDEIPSLLQGADYDAICIRSKHPTRPFPPSSDHYYYFNRSSFTFLPIYAIRISSSKPVIEAPPSPYCFNAVVLGFVLIHDIIFSMMRHTWGR